MSDHWAKADMHRGRKEGWSLVGLALSADEGQASVICQRPKRSSVVQPRSVLMELSLFHGTISTENAVRTM